jgi:hypothetical protein
MKTIVFGSVVLLFCTVSKALAPTYFEFLPLGGSSIAETGIVLGLAVGVATLKDTFWNKNEEV